MSTIEVNQPNLDPAAAAGTKDRVDATANADPPTPAVKTAEQQPGAGTMTREEVESLVNSLDELTGMLQTSLKFTVHDDSHNIVVKVIDKDTDEVIRQIPSDDLLDLQTKMQELTGILFSENV